MNDRFKFRYVFEKNFGGKLGICYKMPVFNLDDTVRSVFENKIIEYTKFGYKLIAKNQCTGLKDKNEKLIYEGDIARFKDCNDILVINYQKEMACFAPQFYCNGKYGGRLWFDDYDSFECKFYKSNNFEVIGNIYENKESLNENS